jgi:hypothetical protein
MLNHHTNVRTTCLLSPARIGRMLKRPSALLWRRSNPQRTIRVRFGFSFTAAALDGFVEHPSLLLRFQRPIEHNGGTNVS